ncbi:tumor necrosis factor receptor superfamily member 14-like [Mobula hypostoma]|uniref:tumor necrosis factor receptor superfamily member 14-like n=1 Tax=Mobula hypostoma TaxID=723540 RepID=UPI002FC3469B
MFAKMVSALWMIFLITLSILLKHLNSSCSITEYEFKGVCCPKCDPGLYVEEHCTEYGGTICHSCNTGTYQDSLNADEDCLRCTICGEGTYEILACSSTRDTVCDCTEEFYCTNITIDGCRECLKHRRCPPGEQVIRKGNYRRNTECGPCANGNCFTEGSSEKGTKMTETKSITANATNPECNQTTKIILSVIVVFLVLPYIFLLRKQILKYFGLTFGSWLKRKPGNVGNSNPSLQESVEEQGQHPKNINCVASSAEESTYFITPVSDLKDDKLCGRGTKSTKYSELKLAQHEMKSEVHTISAIKSSSSVEPFRNNI